MEMGGPLERSESGGAKPDVLRVGDTNVYGVVRRVLRREKELGLISRSGNVVAGVRVRSGAE